MDELIDFEELIDLNLSLPSGSQRSSQEPITDVLDKMCEAMNESNIAMDNIFKNIQKENDEIALDLDDDIINLDEFENLLATGSLCGEESNLVTDDLLENNEIDMVNMADDATIDLDEFQSISARACLFIDDEDIRNNSNISISHLHRVSSYEVPVEFEDACGYKTECDVIKEETLTSTNKCVLHTVSLESTATSDLKANCIDFNIINPVSNNLKTVNKEYENGLETAKCKIETNVSENIVTLTMNNDSELKYENAGEASVTDCKNTIVTEGFTCMNTDSDDDYDPLDFEFISEQEASKAGIYTRINKTINTTNSTNSSKNAANKLQTRNIQENNDCISKNSNIDDKSNRKNEASWSDYVKYSKYRYQRCYAHPATDHHVIPEGEAYLDMFRGQYAPVVVNNLYSLSNKRVLSAVAMAANFEELAYRGPGLMDEANEKYKDDAEDCLKKILSTYPRENRRKRRRH